MNAHDGPEYSPHSPEGLDIAAFIKELDTTRQKYRIKVTAKLTSDIEARRIAILAANCYLKHGGNVHQAGFLERDIYEAAKMLDLACNPISAEIRIEELSMIHGKREVFRNFNSLKLSIEGKERYLTTYTFLDALIIRKLNIIEENAHERIHKFKDRRFDQRRSISRAFQSRALNHKKMEGRKRITLREVG